MCAKICQFNVIFISMLTAYFDLFVEKRNESNLNCLDNQITFNFNLKIIDYGPQSLCWWKISSTDISLLKLSACNLLNYIYGNIDAIFFNNKSFPQ